VNGGLLQGIHAANIASKPAHHPHSPPKPLVAPTGSPGINCVVDMVNNVAAPFQSVPSADEGACGVVAHVLGGVLGAVGAPEQILDTAFAAVSAPLAKLMPALPAVTPLGMHVGPPHGHSHPPSYVPPRIPARIRQHVPHNRCRASLVGPMTRVETHRWPSRVPNSRRSGVMRFCETFVCLR
jgi:hypothetical protein